MINVPSVGCQHARVFTIVLLHYIPTMPQLAGIGNENVSFGLESSTC
jgi:hypothetical protein